MATDIVKMNKTISMVLLCLMTYIGITHSTTGILVMDVDTEPDIVVPTTPAPVAQYTARNLDRNVQKAKVFAMKRYYASRKTVPHTTAVTRTSTQPEENYETFSISTTTTTTTQHPVLLSQSHKMRYTHSIDVQPEISPILTKAKDVSWKRLELPGFAAATERAPCPTDRCYCQPVNTQGDRYSIFCKYQKLGAIPTNFTVVDIVYYELTFSEGNYITNIPYYAFRNIKVERINLLKNNLQSIESGAFLGLEPHLRELLLEGDRLMPVPYDKISNLGRLQMLQLKNFRQDTIENNNYFGQFPNLEVLQMYKIYTLTTIQSMAFQNKLLNLTQLEFQSVYFNQIPVAALIHLPSLKKLYIKQTPITAIYSQSFEKMNNLIDLDLSHNKIEILEANTFVGLEDQLIYLDLTFNELSSDSLVALSSKTWLHLDQLSLSYNSDLGNMPENVFQGMAMLQYLSLVEINMKEIKLNTFSGLNNLHTLDLSWNKLAVIHAGAFQAMPHLYELRLNSQFQTYGHNAIPLSIFMDFSPYSFQGIEHSLVTLNMEQTPFKPEQFWEPLKLFTNLEELRLSETRIRQIPDFSFVNNKKLTTMELKQNNIDQISQYAFSGLEQSLKSIYLDLNNLTTISHCVFDNFTGLDFLHLAGNKLHCDCRLKWLHNFITDRYGVVPYFFKDEFQCSTPAAMAYKYLADIPIVSLTCSDNAIEVCVVKEYIPLTTTQTPTTTQEPSITTEDSSILALTVAGTTKYSITVAWRVKDKTDITGFKLVYYQTIEKQEKQVLIHRDEFLYTIHNLQPGMFYAICITAETNSNMEPLMKDCRTTATEGLNQNTNSQDGASFNADGMDNGGNIVLGAIIGSIAFVILVIVGLYLVVKYKLQKLKDMQLSLSQTQRARRHTPGNNGDDKVCTIPNDYTDIENATIAKRFQGSSARQLNRQFGFESESNEGYESIRRFHREPGERQPETVGKSDNQLNVETAGDRSARKRELEVRYSAPSRLNAVDLMQNDQALCRPLPVIPTAGTSSTALYENQYT